jgi:translation initiation factor IF-3
VNERIRIAEVRLIDHDGGQLGVFQTRDALQRARDQGLDLVEISPNARPPVCKIMDYGKYKYEQSKKKHEAKKKQTIVHLKEIQMRPATGEHDLQVKIGHLKRFLEHGDKAKITVRFRGRELARMSLGRELLEKVIAELVDYGEVDQHPKREGRSMSLVLKPKKKTKK